MQLSVWRAIISAKPAFTVPCSISVSILILAIFALTQPVFCQEPNRPATLTELRERLVDHVSAPRFAAALWGVKIVSLDSGKTLFETNAQKLFSPASNSKLYTVALSLDRLGADYHIKTSLYSQTKPNARRVLKGDLIVYGRGDPTINAHLHGNDIYQALEPFVAALKKAGIERITGDLVGDDSYFHGPPYGSGWAWDDAENYYGAEISALTINDNSLQVIATPGKRPGDHATLRLIPPTSYVVFSNRTETGEPEPTDEISFYRPLSENVIHANGKLARVSTNDVTMHNPAGLFVSWFKQALAKQGIKVDGKCRTANWLDRQAAPLNFDKLVELGSVESLPMSDIAREIMKPSQNLYTDLLLAHVGERQRQSDEHETSEDLGIRELNKFLGEVGIQRGDVLFEEGSGLSRNNLTTPNATIALLEYMNRHKCAETYLNAMPIAGVDGTLRSRMKGTPAAGNVRAKTGTLRWANSLSGHVRTAAGERLVFSVMLNRYYERGPGRTARANIDGIAILLASFTGRSDK
jgi:D-alanyl-D-alanine carboxypeptidase/D-alanyl-D-alanine-endopeptidase (penicillin-binding protein 4)